MRSFVALAKSGSFTRAAEELHLSQSAVSHSIKALETDLGCRLLDRMGKTISLTLAGEQFLQHARKILDEMQLARSALERLGKWGRTRLRIGASATACQYLLPAVLREFQKRFPQCQVTIAPGDTAEVQPLLERGEIDLAIALEPRQLASQEFLPVFTDELCFVLNPGHAWAVAGGVERLAIPSQNYILYSRNSCTFQLVQDYFRRDDVELNLFIELGDMEAIKELVKVGLGISILAPWLVRRELKEGTLVALPLGRRKLHRQWGILRRRSGRPALAEETFVSLCRAASEDLLLAG
ncbi:MAG: LysR family transcriptional regulator, low CO2-responsive transcriptional regulator [Verrucomicrobiota bacterium]